MQSPLLKLSKQLTLKGSDVVRVLVDAFFDKNELCSECLVVLAVLVENVNGADDEARRMNSRRHRS